MMIVTTIFIVTRLLWGTRAGEGWSCFQRQYYRHYIDGLFEEVASGLIYIVTHKFPTSVLHHSVMKNSCC